MVVYPCNPNYSQFEASPGKLVRHRWEDRGARPAPSKNMRPYLKNNYTIAARAGGMGRMVEYLPSKDEALSSSSSTTKNVKKTC
jgi:hypothetical protein